MEKILLEMQSIIKDFPGVRALDNVNLQVRESEVHALVGENGAGKSTLMNILSGWYGYGTYEGKIIYDGKECEFHSLSDSEKVGIVIIHQELGLIPYLSIAENMFLGNETARKVGLLKVIDWNECHNKAIEMLNRVGLDENPETLIKDIGVGKQQMVEIAKAMAKNVRLLILDEPTASLNDQDSEHLLELIRGLKEKGVTCIIISHKLNEVEKIADAITIIRDGTTIETLYKGIDEFTQARVIKGMVGREMKDRYPKRVPKIGEVCFEVKNWNVEHPLFEGKKIIENANFNVRKGEIVGFAGLMGSGRTELAMSVFGKAYGKNISGTIIKNGQEIVLGDISDAISKGIMYLTEDRKGSGLNAIDDIRHNITIANLQTISNGRVINQNEEIKVAEEYRDRLAIRSTGIWQTAGTLSGGNQQKVMLSRGLFANPDVLILDEPTRGIDVGSKYEIYSFMNKLVEEGKAVIFISSEMPELLGMCDRIFVLNEGHIIAELTGDEISQENIMEKILTDTRERSEHGTD
jgi:putative multiple sugar transport system ATP-binding protein